MSGMASVSDMEEVEAEAGEVTLPVSRKISSRLVLAKLAILLEPYRTCNRSKRRSYHDTEW